MLTRAGENFAGRAVIPVQEAAFPVPFRGGLEFNPPVHETWNIVHIGMMVPESHQIYICADNCMRGVVLTAAEMGALDRFSSVVLTEKDFYDGRLEEITLEGVTDVIRKLPYRPRTVLVFPVCTHHFVGTDMRYVYRELEKRFPKIDFCRCWMDPIMQKQGLTPDQKERKAIFDLIPVQEKDETLAVDIGSNLPLSLHSDLAQVLENAGMKLGQIQTCSDYDAFLQLGQASLVINRIPAHEHSTRHLAQRIGARYLYLPPEVSYQKIRQQYRQLGEAFQEISPAASENLASKEAVAGTLFSENLDVSKSLSEDYFAREEAACEAAFSSLKVLVKDTRIELDAVALIRPVAVARLLIEHGFNVRCIWLDAIVPEEEEDFLWLQAHAPQLTLGCPINVTMRTRTISEEMVLAVGPKAAWASGTTHFVNILEQDGGWGYQGVQHLLTLMEEAYLEEKDTRAIVPRKGLGCRCVLDDSVLSQA